MLWDLQAAHRIGCMDLEQSELLRRVMCTLVEWDKEIDDAAREEYYANKNEGGD